MKKTTKGAGTRTAETRLNKAMDLVNEVCARDGLAPDEVIRKAVRRTFNPTPGAWNLGKPPADVRELVTAEMKRTGKSQNAVLLDTLRAGVTPVR